MRIMSQVNIHKPLFQLRLVVLQYYTGTVLHNRTGMYCRRIKERSIVQQCCNLGVRKPEKDFLLKIIGIVMVFTASITVYEFKSCSCSRGTLRKLEN